MSEAFVPEASVVVDSFCDVHEDSAIVRTIAAQSKVEYFFTVYWFLLVTNLVLNSMSDKCNVTCVTVGDGRTLPWPFR